MLQLIVQYDVAYKLKERKINLDTEFELYSYNIATILILEVSNSFTFVYLDGLTTA